MGLFLKYKLKKVIRIADRVFIPTEILNKVLEECRKKFPFALAGIFYGKKIISDYYFFQKNVRSNREYSDFFEQYGEFYKDNRFGFVLDSREQLKLMRDIEMQDKKILAVFHTHIIRKAIPTKIDLDLAYPDPGIFHVIIAMRNPRKPDVRAFKFINQQFEKIKIVTKKLTGIELSML